MMAVNKNKKKKTDTDEVVFEDESGAAKDAAEKTKKALKLCEKERKEYLDGWKRAKADALNEKKRQQDFADRERTAALVKYVLAMLPVLDSVRAAIGQEMTKTAQAGVEQIHNQCLRSFSDLGVTLIDAVGEVFDPHRYQSIGEQEVTDKKKDNTVAEVMRIGASVGDTVIRPAMVYVGVYKKEKKKTA